MRSNLKAVGLACIVLSFLGAVLASIGEVSRPAVAQSNHSRHRLAPAPAHAGQQPATLTPGANGTSPQGIIIITNTPTRTPTPINIGNFVWDDLDKDGRQDAGEPGLPNVTVELYGAQGLIDTAVTNANGLYNLTAPTPGDYRVRVVLPSILDHFTAKDQAGGDDLLDSDINPSGGNTGYTDVFTLASNVISITKIDAGIVVYRPPTPTRTPTPINIGNFVWRDSNSNGIQDAGEVGVPNVTVELYGAQGLIDTAVTNANGLYNLTAPTPGDYRVRVVLPGAGAFSPKDQGGDDLEDSDANSIGINAGFTDTFTLASNVISITKIDIGLINLPAILPTVTPSPTLAPTAMSSPTLTPTVLPSVQPVPSRLHLPVVVK